VPIGKIKIVLFDPRKNSPTVNIVEEFSIGHPSNYVLITTSPMIWYGFLGLSLHPALIANCADLPHYPDESERLEIDSKQVPFTWK
jgi:dTDP-4-dehydrorhamnose 3,5-epimerase